jgi:hypothetical protein
VNAVKTKHMVIPRDQKEGRSQTKYLETVPLTEWKISNNLERPENIKVLFRKKIRADGIQRTLIIIPCNIFCLPAFISKNIKK